MIRPRAGLVFVRPVVKTETASGLILVDTDEVETEGDVVAVGEGVTEVSVGDHVLLAPTTGVEARFDHSGEKLIILSADEILGVYE